MGLDFSDERISAYLDGELPNDERVAVEQLLTESPEHRQLLAELSAMRHELQSLPKQRLPDDFAQRVVAAAVAAQAATVLEETAVTPASLTVERLTSRSKKRNRWSSPFMAVPALAAAALVAVMIAQRPWEAARRPGPAVAVLPTPIAATVVDLSPVEQAIAQLRSASPATGEALVVRVRLPRSTSPQRDLDAALAKSGIKLGLADQAAVANQVGSVFRQKLLERNASELEAKVASDALFIEAPLAQIEGALRELSSQSPTAAVSPGIGLKLEMIVSAKLARSADSAEGEGGSAAQVVGVHGPVAHRLNAGMFLLPKEVVSDASMPSSVSARAKPDPQQAIRVLILVEAAE